MTRQRLATLCCALFLAVLLAPAAAHAAPPSSRMVQKINAFRAAHGLPSLRPSRVIDRSAKGWAGHLMRSGRFSHMGIHASRRFPVVGEVLSYHRGWRARQSRTVRAWLRSPGHRAALLSTTFRYVGAGRARGRLGGPRTTIWVVQFGARRR